MNTNKSYCGFIAIIGKNNVGKSTLLNKLIGQKISITSYKAQTTRHKILGIHTKDNYQAIYVDTPGFQITGKRRTTDRLINKTISNLINGNIYDIKVIIFVVEGTSWTQDDKIVLNKINKKTNVVLVVNKIDHIQKRAKLISHLSFLARQMSFLDIIPVSAETGINIRYLSERIYQLLPEASHLFPTESITNLPQYFIASEIIREKVIRFTGAEIPYSVNIKIERFIGNELGEYNINGLIFVERKGQKKIIIGNKGSKIKIIGTEARKDMQKIFKMPVHLKLWVKIKLDCNNNENYILTDELRLANHI